MKHYLENIDEVCRDVKTGVDGITSQEAESRLESNGKNKLAEGKKEPIILRLLKQFIEPMTLILIVAAIISGILTVVNNSSGGKKEFPSDVIIIMAVVIINAVLGVVQESKAEKAIDALQKIAAATSKVIRDGKLVVVKSEDLVVGDVIVLEAGDAVPADARIIECASMKAEEAALTGESVPVLKTSDAIAHQTGKYLSATGKTWYLWAAPSFTAEARRLSSQRVWIPKWAKSRPRSLRRRKAKRPFNKSFRNSAKCLRIS